MVLLQVIHCRCCELIRIVRSLAGLTDNAFVAIHSPCDGRLLTIRVKISIQKENTVGAVY